MKEGEGKKVCSKGDGGGGRREGGKIGTGVLGWEVQDEKISTFSIRMFLHDSDVYKKKRDVPTEDSVKWCINSKSFTVRVASSRFVTHISQLLFQENRVFCEISLQCVPCHVTSLQLKIVHYGQVNNRKRFHDTFFQNSHVFFQHSIFHM